VDAKRSTHQKKRTRTDRAFLEEKDRNREANQENDRKQQIANMPFSNLAKIKCSICSFSKFEKEQILHLILAKSKISNLGKFKISNLAKIKCSICSF